MTFDPTKPYEVEGEAKAGASAPAFDPSKPFTEEKSVAFDVTKPADEEQDAPSGAAAFGHELGRQIAAIPIRATEGIVSGMMTTAGGLYRLVGADSLANAAGAVKRDFAATAERADEPMRMKEGTTVGGVGEVVGGIAPAFVPGVGVGLIMAQAGEAGREQTAERIQQAEGAVAPNDPRLDVAFAAKAPFGIVDRVFPKALTEPASLTVRSLVRTAGEGAAGLGLQTLGGNVIDTALGVGPKEVTEGVGQSMVEGAALGAGMRTAGELGKSSGAEIARAQEAQKAAQAELAARAGEVRMGEEAPAPKPEAPGSPPFDPTKPFTIEEPVRESGGGVPSPVEAAPVAEAGRMPALPEETVRAPAPETFTVDDFYGVPVEAVRVPDEAPVVEPDTSVPFEAAAPAPVAELPESIGPALRRRFTVSEEVRNARIARAQEAKAAEWAAQLKPGVDAEPDTGAPVWSALPEERVNAALDLPQFRTQAEAELSRRFNAEVENDARAQSGLSLKAALDQGLLKLPSGEGDLRSEILALHKNIGDQAQWSRWSSKKVNLEQTLAKARELGFDVDRNGLLDAIDRTIRGKDVYANAAEGVLSDKAAGARVDAPRLAPNGQPSKFDAADFGQVRSKEFKRWFGDWERDPANASKAVDENGEPLVVYHGSPKFAEFWNFKGGEGHVGQPIFTTTSRDVAKGYAVRKAGDMRRGVYSLYLNLKNPMEVTGLREFDQRAMDEAFRKAKAEGHDGVVFRNMVDVSNVLDGRTPSDIWTAFNPKALKSATGNHGEFNPNDSNILHDAAPGSPSEAQTKAQRAAMIPDREALPADTAGRVSIDPTGGERYVFPAETPGWDMPAFVKLGHELGATLKVRDLGEGKGGDFSPGTNRLRLNKELFKNPQEALRVMAHEIGHLIDTKNTGLKGPVWERLSGAKGAAKDAFALEGTMGAEGRIPDANDRKGAWLAAKGITEGALGPRDQYVAEAAAFGKGAALKAGADWDAAQSQAFRDHWGKLLKTEGWGTGAMIRDELKRWSETIRPYDKATADPKFAEYRNSPDEITADALSGILAYPKTFAAAAPTAWRAFWGHLESRPVTAGKILEGIELLNGSPAKRAKAVSLDFQKGGYEAGEKYLARMAEEKAARERIDATRLRQIAMGTRRTLVDKFAPARNKGNTFALDDAAHADGKTWEWTGRLQHELYEPMKAAGVDARDFGELLMLRRILAGDRSEFANPGGVDKSYATKQAAEVLNRYSPEQRAVISQGFAKVSGLWREAMNTAVESGLVSPAKLAELREKAGDTYVPFAAAEYFNGHVGAGIKAMQGNLGGIADPLLALSLKAGSVFRAAALNKGRLAALDGLAENIPDLDMTLAKSDPRTGRAIENPKPGMVHVEVSRGGEKQTWNVPAEYKTVFEAMTPANAAPMGAALRWMFANGWRELMIGKNPAFQAWSGPIKDARRSFINMPGIDSASLRPSVELAGNILYNLAESAGVKIPKALQSKYRQAAVDFVEGRPNKLTDALVREGGMPPPHELFAVQKAAAPAHVQDAAMLEMFRQRKLLPEEVSQRSGLTKMMGVKQAADFVRYMGKRVERLGQTNEALVKTAAFGELLKRGANEADAGRFVRTQIGIPDTRQGGDFSRVANTIAPFYNVAVAGARADLNQMVRGLPEFSGSSIKGLNTPAQVRRAAITKLMVGTGVPVIAAVLARQGLFGEKAKEVMGRVSDHDERTGLMVPVGETRGRDGMMKTVAVKVPFDASEVWFANLIKNSLEASLGQTTVSDAAGEQLKATTDLVPGLDKTMDLVRAWTSYAKGDNPTDNWRQSPIVRASAQGARATGELEDKLPAMWDMSAWTLAQTGWWSHKPDDGGPGAEGVEGAAAMPFLSRALRVTNAGEIESMRKADAVFDGQADALRATLPEPVQRLSRELAGVRDLYPTLVDKQQRGVELTPAEQSRLERYRVLNNWGSSYNELVRAAVLAKRQGDKASEAEIRKALEEVSAPYYPGAQ